MKNSLAMGTGVVLGAGLMAAMVMGVPETDRLGDWWPGNETASERTSATNRPATTRVRVGGEVIRTQTRSRGSEREEERERSEPQRVEYDGNVIRTRGEPKDDAPTEPGEAPPTGQYRRDLEEFLRDYDRRNEAYRDSMPVDPDVAEKMLRNLRTEESSSPKP